MLSTAEEVKRKFNSLRTYYNKELKKVQSSKKSGTGTGELYISGWIYYDALDVFLKHQVLPRRTLSNMVSILCTLQAAIHVMKKPKNPAIQEEQMCLQKCSANSLV